MNKLSIPLSEFIKYNNSLVEGKITVEEHLEKIKQFEIYVELLKSMKNKEITESELMKWNPVIESIRNNIDEFFKSIENK